MNLCYAASLIFIIALDRWTKSLALYYLQTEPYIVNDYISAELLINRGISWGLLSSADSAIFFIVSTIIALMTLALIYFAYTRATLNYPIIGEIMVIAGSISNLLDRIMYGGVIDFIALSYHGYSWPIFNVADIFIVMGIFIMLWYNYES